MRARAFHGALALAGLLAACEQGRGDSCQRDSDCQDPLICVAATKQCQPVGVGGDVDAAPMVPFPDFTDADLRDAGPRFDAAPELDAAPIDAAPIDAAAIDAAPIDAAR